ncbi:MAG: HEAT repeat domain-containing protein [Promethearchaeota archaeon]
MSKEIRNIIDTVEEENQTKAQMEQTIKFLKEEIGRLNFRLSEQKKLIQDQEKKLEKQEKVPPDVQLLKEMVLSQRQDLIKKDKDIDILKDRIDELTLQLEKTRNGSKYGESNELLEAKKLIVKLTDENERLHTSQEDSQKLISELQEENVDLKNELEDIYKHIEELKAETSELDATSELNAAKEKIKQLEKQNEIYISEINELRDQLHELQDNLIGNNLQFVSKLEEQTIKSLRAEIDDLQSLIVYLKQKLEKKGEKQSDYKDSINISDEVEKESQYFEGDSDEKRTINSLIEKNKSLSEEIKKLQENLKLSENSSLDDNLIKKYKEDLNLANKKIDNLMVEIEDYQAQVLTLQQKLDSSEKSGEKTLINEVSSKEERKEEIINELLEENESYRLEIENLKNELRQIELNASIKGDDSVDIEIENLQAQIAYLRQELEKNKKESKEPVILIEDSDNSKEDIAILEEDYLKTKKKLNTANLTIDNLINDIESYRKEISEQNEEIRKKNSKISVLQSRIESLKNQIIELKEKETEKPIIEGSISKIIDNNVNLEKDYGNTETRELIKNLQNENQELLLKLKELESSKSSTPIKYFFNLDYGSYIPRSYQNYLILKIYDFLGEYNKETVLELLIKSLESNNLDIKRFAIDILSEIQGTKALNALLNMKNDKDWIIRLSLIRALIKFDSTEIVKTLEDLTKDIDVDVREYALKALKKFNNNNKREPSIKEYLEPNKWNWSEEAKQWVYVDIIDGKKNLTYQLEPPQEFIKLSLELKNMNDKLMAAADVDEKLKIYKDLMKISEKMQKMGRY